METEWVEFKHNNSNPDSIGEYISSLANSAAINVKAHAYLIWGIDNNSHEIMGTSFDPKLEKVGNEELENWLLKLLTPKIDFHFYRFNIDDKQVVLLEISRAYRHPVQFKGAEYIRVGSYQKRLKDHPERERKLWRIFDETPFENMCACEELQSEDVIQLLDYPSYFDLLGYPLPETRTGILEFLEADSMIEASETGRWNITNLGAVLFAKSLKDFGSLKRKAVRVISYKGESRIDTKKEQEGNKGYASGYKGLIGYINSLLPSNEIIEQALRKTVPMYPELAVREAVVNALIHQDFFITGSGPMIEIFQDRMEITNPGQPLVDTARFLDTPPRSRNDTLASLMRRIGICEERGSGIDKIVSQTENYQLPAPLFEVAGQNTKVVLFAHKDFNEMEKEDRIRACYLHACLKFVNRQNMTNATLRDRFGIEARNSAIASRILKETIEAGKIKPYDESASRKYMKYVPYWA